MLQAEVEENVLGGLMTPEDNLTASAAVPTRRTGLPSSRHLHTQRVLSTCSQTARCLRAQLVQDPGEERRHLECARAHAIPATRLQFSGAGTQTKKLCSPLSVDQISVSGQQTQAGGQE